MYKEMNIKYFVAAQLPSSCSNMRKYVQENCFALRFISQDLSIYLMIVLYALRGGRPVYVTPLRIKI